MTLKDMIQNNSFKIDSLLRLQININKSSTGYFMCFFCV